MKKIAFLIAASFLFGCGTGGGGSGGVPEGGSGAPTATVSDTTLVSQTGATLHGSVNPNGLDTQAWFEYGTDAALSAYTSTAMQPIGSASRDVPVEQPVSGCTPGTIYYYRVCGGSAIGTAKSTITTFTTLSPGAVPTVSTLAATSITASDATLNGSVTPNGLSTIAWFEWGTNSVLSAFFGTSPQSIGAGTAGQPINDTLTGLSAGATYYYRVVASNAMGTSPGAIRSFVTSVSSLISLNIVSPASGALVGTSFDLVVSVTSRYQQAEATVRLDDGPELPLSFSSQAYCVAGGCYPGWVRTISLDGMARGNHGLVVTAKDIFNNAATSSRVVVYDRKPDLVVMEPLNHSVARPAIHVTAACTDDDPAGCASIRVTVGPDAMGSTVIAEGKDAINQDVSLAMRDGTVQQMCVTARDYAGQEAKDCRSVYVESSARLAEVTSVSGLILDVSSDRILFLDGTTLKIRQRLSGMETGILNPANPTLAFLTPLGAIWVDVPGNVLTAKVLEWRNGSITDLGFPNSAHSLKVAGKYAIWCAQPNLYLRDLEAGSTSTISAAAGNWKNDVTAGGAVAWWGTDYQVRLGNHQITFGPEWNTYPLTDGKNVVYRKHLPAGLAIYLYDGTSEAELAAAAGSDPQYRVANGYVAFTRQEVGGAIQVHLRSQAGTRQVSIFGTGSSPETLGPDGSITFINQNARYLDFSTNKVGSGLGRATQIDGIWHVVIGRSVFRLI